MLFTDEGKEYLVKMLESDVEPANRKTQWISEKELEEELMQVRISLKRISPSRLIFPFFGIRFFINVLN